MKRYLVERVATLAFPNGSRVTLETGIQNYPDEVAAHWAFSAYAKPLDNPTEQQEQQGQQGEQGEDKSGKADKGKVDGKKQQATDK
ncbi:hypothetical protein FEM41_14855 [Jejubacter calystegiae]|uniref:Uncharacterized protein n=1 Tax=Jejubacter calystegiae TaxID=2579935 RepID=A0A4P8YMC4_9ENTR|nr:hypothetical protein [Jejubacter calystegiae]QCT20834.1 hypothetical protein FEM41_14855 [Jejubacter calystegiae]